MEVVDRSEGYYMLFTRGGIGVWGFVVVAIVASNQASSAAPIKWACIGNSITEGYPNPENSYVPSLQRLLGAGYAVQNDGASGRTLLRKGDDSYWTTGKLYDVFASTPAIVSIKLGTNDSKPQNWVDSVDFVSDLTALIDTVQTIQPKPTVWLFTPCPAWSNSYGINGALIKKSIVPRIKQLARTKGLPVIDLNSALAGHPELFPDGVHPSAAGADSIAGIIYRAFKGTSEIVRLASSTGTPGGIHQSRLSVSTKQGVIVTQEASGAVPGIGWDLKGARIQK